MAPVTALPVQGRHVALTVNPSGDVVAAEAQAAPSAAGGWWGAGEAALRSVIQERILSQSSVPPGPVPKPAGRAAGTDQVPEAAMGRLLRPVCVYGTPMCMARHHRPVPTPHPTGPPPAATGSNNTGAGGAPRLTLAPPALSQEWALGEGAFRPGAVGAKAHNLAELRRSLPEWIHVSLHAA